jgi:hypothetical protein
MMTDNERTRYHNALRALKENSVINFTYQAWSLWWGIEWLIGEFTVWNNYLKQWSIYLSIDFVQSCYELIASILESDMFHNTR